MKSLPVTDRFKEDRVRRFWARNPQSRIRPMLLQRLYPDIFRKEDSKAHRFLEAFFRKRLSHVDFPAYSHMIRWENANFIKTFFSNEFRERTEKDDGFVDRFISALPGEYMKWDPLSRVNIRKSLSSFPTTYSPLRGTA